MKVVSTSCTDETGGINAIEAVPPERAGFELRPVVRAAFIGFSEGIGGVQIDDLDLPRFHTMRYPTVFGFGDAGRFDRFDLVFVDADVFDPEIIGKILGLRALLSTHAHVQIVAVAGFSPGAFSHRLEQSGCFAVIKRGRAALEHFLDNL